MLTKDERILLENALESLNRLFDRVSTVSDVQSLFLATAMALRGTEIASAFEGSAQRLAEIVRSNALPDRKRDLGLVATDGLRKLIAEQLRRDANENPRQRHVAFPKIFDPTSDSIH